MPCVCVSGMSTNGLVIVILDGFFRGGVIVEVVEVARCVVIIYSLGGEFAVAEL